MSSHAFADFLEQLQAEGQLVRHDAPVQKRVEASVKAEEIAPRSVLFTDVTGSRFPLVVGVYSSEGRVLAALDASSTEEVATRIDGIAAADKGISWLERLSGDSSTLSRKYQPRSVRTGPSQQIVQLGRDVDLSSLPIPTFHSDEEFPPLTSGRLFVRSPDGDRLHVGVHDFRVIDSNRLVANWPPSSQPARILAAYFRRGETMPVAIAYGGAPADLLTAMAPLPYGTSTLELCGYLRGTACELIQGRQVDLPVPADAELVIEGTITPGDCAEAGSGLDATGQLRRLQPGPVIHVQAMTHRSPPLFSAFVPGEKASIQRVLVKVFLPLLRAELPDLCELAFPAFGGDRIWAFASIDKTYSGQAKRFAHAFWGLTQMLPVRYLAVVDADVDVGCPEEVWKAVAAHAAPSPDIRMSDSIPDEFLYDQPPGRMAIDATRPLS